MLEHLCVPSLNQDSNPQWRAFQIVHARSENRGRADYSIQWYLELALAARLAASQLCRQVSVAFCRSKNQRELDLPFLQPTVSCVERWSVRLRNRSCDSALFPPKTMPWKFVHSLNIRLPPAPTFAQLDRGGCHFREYARQ